MWEAWEWGYNHVYASIPSRFNLASLVNSQALMPQLQVMKAGATRAWEHVEEACLTLVQTLSASNFKLLTVSNQNWKVWEAWKPRYICLILSPPFLSKQTKQMFYCFHFLLWIPYSIFNMVGTSRPLYWGLWKWPMQWTRWVEVWHF